MAVIVRNDRGKVLGRISKVGAYIDLRGIKQRMTPVEAYKFATELAAFVGAVPPAVASHTAGSAAKMIRTPTYVTYPDDEPTGPTCEVCGKRFKDGRGRAGHARTHAGQELGVA